ncbi:hypothetical protein BDV32DRAFT_82238 [Aspergillus pseudonomiae]|nr:hypothetical protein BDV32DRAFT_82238 [Aspergillus pseudonomiae]
MAPCLSAWVSQFYFFPPASFSFSFSFLLRRTDFLLPSPLAVLARFSVALIYLLPLTKVQQIDRHDCFFLRDCSLLV